ncbi:hypothetical protein GCM10010266_62060 [Streptomyces griseomycini]|nr:hypothetical protein GCM10010266_62060 [Streptomyces griseomycini]
MLVVTAPGAAGASTYRVSLCAGFSRSPISLPAGETREERRRTAAGPGPAFGTGGLIIAPGQPADRADTPSPDGRSGAPALVIASVTVIIFSLAVTSTARGGGEFLRAVRDGDDASPRHL